MVVRILGCSGGVGHRLRTTSFLIDNDVLIDAGSGVGDLSLDELAAIRHVFLTHSHLDHVAFLPLLLDSVFDRIEAPIVVHALPETVAALRDHVFNGLMWPDFTVLPRVDRPVLRLAEMKPGDVCQVDERSIELIAVNHTVAAAGYRVASSGGVFAFSGDTGSNDGFWEALNRHATLDYLFVEATFPNRQRRLAEVARHYTPELLGADLEKLRHEPQVFLSHFSAGNESLIFRECRRGIRGRKIDRLRRGSRFEI